MRQTRRLQNSGNTVIRRHANSNMHRRAITTAAGLFFICWSFAFLALMHHQSFSPDLRYTRISEGNITEVVHSIWHEGFSAYIGTLEGDARHWGRIRPTDWLYYNTPFILTLIRNGDFFRPNADVPLSYRINGDLQTHSLFLVANLAIAAGLISWMIWLVSGSLLMALLLPLYFSLSFSICENLLIYYCDSQEIPQLLFLACYLFSIRNIFSQKVPNKGQEIFASIFLALAYGVKETTVVALPVIGIVLGVALLQKPDRTIGFKRFCLRHIGLHVLYTVFLLSAVWFYRSGAYVTKNYLIGPNIRDKIDFTANVLTKDVPLLPMLIVGGVFAIFCLRTVAKKVSLNSLKNLKNISFLLLTASGLFAGFLLINLPWDVSLIKYYLPVVFFAACSIILLQAFVYRLLSYQGLRAAAIIWIIGTSFFMLKNFNSQRLNISHFYQQNYGYRKSVPIISQDIASRADSMHRPQKVLIIAEKTKWRFFEGALPFLRYTNLVYDVNIRKNGEIVHSISSVERNYFRIYPRRPAVEIVLEPSFPKRLDFDEIYVVNRTLADVDKFRIASLGYILKKKWDARKSGVNVVKYSRSFADTGLKG